MQAFKDAKDAAEKARADLGLAKDAKAALDEAQTILANAKAQAEQIIKAASAKAIDAEERANVAEERKKQLFADLR